MKKEVVVLDDKTLDELAKLENEAAQGCWVLRYTAPALGAAARECLPLHDNENKRLKDMVTAYPEDEILDLEKLRDLCAALRTENERLKDIVISYTLKTAALEAENERLRSLKFKPK
jgi:hypothetical protein